MKQKIHPEYNLLKEKWIPVYSSGHGPKNISLKELLCKESDWQLSFYRDDMELACLQLIVCMVQVIFMPQNFEELQKAYEEPMKEDDYDKGASSFKEWFDLLHPKYPFMQLDLSQFKTKPKKAKKVENLKSLQKLLVGLPEETSDSPFSNAHFNRTDEIQEMTLGQTAIALFQQATNGFGLGGSKFRVGLKGSMPVTTLIYDESRSLRKSIWCNIITGAFLKNKIRFFFNETVENIPTWLEFVSFDKKQPEHAHKIGLMRGLFWQPAKVQLEVKPYQTNISLQPSLQQTNCPTNSYKVIGFRTETGASHTKGFWRHPHTPIAWHKNKKETQSNSSSFHHISIKKEHPLWGHLLEFLYTDPKSKEEGHSRALVVDHYVDGLGRGKSLNLSVGGYIKGDSIESLIGRKHEIYSFKSGWQDKQKDFSDLIHFGLQMEKVLSNSIGTLGKNIKWEQDKKGEGQKKSNFIKKMLEPKAKKIYFNNSEVLIHEILRALDWDKTQVYKKQFYNLAVSTYNEVIVPYEHDPKLLKAIEIGRRLLHQKLKGLLK